MRHFLFVVEMKTFLKKYLYFHCIIINNDIKDIFTLKAVLIKAFLLKLLYLRAKVRFLGIFLWVPPPHGGGNLSFPWNPTLVSP